MAYSHNEKSLDSLVENLDKKGIKAVTIYSSDYPEYLLNTDCPPFVLYCKGDVALLKSKCFAIVGTRRITNYGRAITEKFTKGLVDAGFTIVSGLSCGVDTIAHQTTLDKGGKTIAVLAGGFKHIYPQTNYNLAKTIEETNLLISEYPPNTKPLAYYFPVRNRIIAGLSKGVLIVSGAIKSGTLYTAEYAEEYGKDLFAVPYSVGIKSGAGCNDLIKRGAILTDNPKDILDFYGIEKRSERETFSELEKQIINCLKDGEVHIEKLSASIGRQVFEVTPTLSILEIKGIVARSGNVYGLISNFSEE